MAAPLFEKGGGGGTRMTEATNNHGGGEEAAQFRRLLRWLAEWVRAIAGEHYIGAPVPGGGCPGISGPRAAPVPVRAIGGV